ncbi:hypothetical protein FACS1894164_14040 [Spirochaetia bacterium]|nr:hypothetical protein FACS1894164_14040 [Spirochaetia bacterium]
MSIKLLNVSSIITTIVKKAAPILTFNEHEIEVLDVALHYLDDTYPEEGDRVRERFSDLKKLGEIVIHCPSLNTGDVQGTDLIDVFSALRNPSHVLYTPLKIVLARNFLVTKFQAFSLLFLLIRDAGEVAGQVRKVLLSNICTLMAEDVYISCIADPSFYLPIKIQLVNDLLSLWENGRDPHEIRHFPPLETLWMARDETPPVFGTMDGACELLRVSMAMGSDWHNFLLKESENQETVWALEEFLFGLSHEEIKTVRSALTVSGVRAVGYDEVQSYLDNRTTYTVTKNADPRALYDFYVARRDKAWDRGQKDLPGPHKTIEEIYFRYRLKLRPTSEAAFQ